MPRCGFAEKVRRHVCGEVERARHAGEAFIEFRAGILRRHIREVAGEESSDDTLDICQVMRTAVFAEEARVELMDDSGGERLDTTFRFRILE